MRITANGVEVSISVSHVTEPGEGWKGSKLIAECSSLEELNKVINDPRLQPELYWQ